MNEELRKLKNTILKITKRVLKLLAIPLVIAMIFIIILVGALYVITLDDAKNKEGDKSNTPNAVQEYSNDIIINAEGNIDSAMTAQELWDQLIENGSNIEQYLEGPEELLPLMNAQLVTQYLDTRPNPDDPIDWNTINDVNSTKMQGIIKLKRATAEGQTKTMTYVDPTTFQQLIDRYNATGSQADREKALSHFTLEKGVVSGQSQSGESSTIDSLEDVVFIGDSFTVGLEQSNLINNASFYAKVGVAPQYWLDHFSELPADSDDVKAICVLLGVNNPYQIDEMKQLITNLTQQYPNKNIYVQRVFPVGINYTYADRDVLNAQIDTFNNEIESYCSNVSKVRFIDTTTGYINSNGVIESSLLQNDGLHLKSYDRWAQNIEDEIVGTSNNNGNNNDSNNDNNSGNVGNSELYWPSDATSISSPFGNRTSPTPGASTNHKGIDIAAPMNSNVYACEAGTVTVAEYRNAEGNIIVIDHGNGYTSQYEHNSSFLVNVGDIVEKGQVIALVGSTGISTGAHLHFQINYNGQAVDPLSFKYSNNMGNGTGTIGSSSTSSNQNSTTTYYAKVATWKEVTDIVESDDPEVNNYSSTSYNMTATKINYQEFVSGYTMPFDYLWALLVVGEDKDFVLDLAHLVHDSQIEITVHDNLTVNTNVNVNTYTKKIKTETKATVNVAYGNSSSDIVDSYDKSGGPWIDEESQNYTTKHTVITKTNTLDTQLTLADVWIVKYTRQFTYEVPANIVTSTSNDLPDEPYPSSPDDTRTGVDTYGHASNLLSSEKSRWTNDYDYVDGYIKSVTENIFYATVNKHEDITNTTESKKYVSSPPVIEEKTDPDSDEPNFVTIFLSVTSAKARRYILNVPSWLFEILESNDSTKEMVDLTKYLLYKATGHSYSVTEFDFSIFDPENFKTVDQGENSIDLLTEYIHYFENSNPPTNADGTKYIIQDDGAGNPTVGYGIDIFNGGFAQEFIQAGYPTYIGGEVDKDFVDNLEKREIQNHINAIKSLTSGLNLTGYQINALVSRAYNCGDAGAVTTNRGSPAMDFVNSYNTYWDESDDQYEEKNSNANFNHSLYVQYMSKPVTAAGYGYMAGLEKRRKSEWTLFQTGYYDVLDKWHSEGGTGGSIIENAKIIHEYMEQNNYTYCVYGGNSYEECGTYGKAHGLNVTFEQSKTGFHNTCCATFVSWVLQEAGYITAQEHTNGANAMTNLLLSKGFTVIRDVTQLEPGDIISYNEHVEIYAGDNTVYNAGSGNSIRSASPQAKNVSGMNMGLRAPD